ncbi:MAG: uracil-xanthine permease family protein [bacterium]|nr:uracil-xanthine permease family protein [bacterium]
MEQSFSKKCLLGMQHVLAMFGATCLVPMLTGLNASIALICAGVGTLIFHLITKRKVPVFLGSSFAFIAAIQYVLQTDQMDAPLNSMITLDNLAKLKGALIVAGLIYMLFALLIKVIGYEKVTKILPPIVTGPMIIVIGLRLSPTAISNAIYENGVFSLRAAAVAFLVVLTIICISVFTTGFINLMPILISLIIGYILCIPFGILNPGEWWDKVSSASFISLTDSWTREQFFVMPKFDINAILAIAPISIVTIIEHVGDITTNGAVVGKNFIADPGVHRTLLGDGVATALAGCFGGPANTTYGENTGVLAVTKNYNPAILRIAACFAIILGIFGNIGAVIQNVPLPVSGGISIVLFGMIASVGVRILINNTVDFSNSRNLMIASLIFVLGIGIDSIQITKTVTISGLAVAAVFGIVFAIILPEKASE